MSSLLILLALGVLFNVILAENLLPGTDVCGTFKVQTDRNGDLILGEHPWVALLKYKNSKDEKHSMCLGVLINKNYVLTAAHCVKIHKNFQLTDVTLGEYNTATDPDCVNEECAPKAISVEVDEVISHENFDTTSKNHYNDIALVRLKTPAEFTEFVKPICLPTTEDLKKINLTGTKLTLASWTPQDLIGKRSDIKNQKLLPFVSLEKCTKVYEPLKISLKEGQFCAGGEKGVDSCKGDAGGPLMAVHNNNWYSIGIVSFGPHSCGQEDFPAVYTQVSKYVDWIVSKIKE